MNDELKEKLDVIVEKKHFHYKGKNVEIEKYKDVNGTNCVIFIDGRPNNFLTKEIPSFIDSLSEPVEKSTYLQNAIPKVAIPKTEMMNFEPTKENSSIKTALLDALELVKKDKDFIPQANAICNIASQMINLQKEEIKMIQILKK